MRKGLMTLMLAFLLSASFVSASDAKDEFEDGFKAELGAIAARSAVGLGVGVFNGVFGHGVHYDGYYGTPTVFHYGHVRPYYIIGNEWCMRRIPDRTVMCSIEDPIPGHGITGRSMCIDTTNAPIATTAIDVR